MKNGLNCQTAGLLPLLALMLLSRYFPFQMSSVIAIFLCTCSLLLYGVLARRKTYILMLLPASFALILYSIFIRSGMELIMYNYTPLVIAWLLVVALSLVSIFRRFILKYIRDAKHPVMKTPEFRAALTEYFYVAQIVQNMYTLYFFVLLYYIIFLEGHRSMPVDRFLYHDAPFVFGTVAVLYELVRLTLLTQRLANEVWLPVINPAGKVIGRIAWSVSSCSNARYCHPVVRLAVVCQGMIYLAPRTTGSPFLQGTLDYPVFGYVKFRRTLEQTVKELAGRFMPWNLMNLRFLVRYTFRNEKVHTMVSLYVALLESEDEFSRYIRPVNGKWWTCRQIEENLHKGIFSEYFEQEYPYLQNTVLLAEGFTRKKKKLQE
jgi:hypothetical protein